MQDAEAECSTDETAFQCLRYHQINTTLLTSFVVYILIY